LNEPDWHRLSRGVSQGTLVDQKNGKKETGVTTAGGQTWDEPRSPYNTRYPDNFVITTHGGIVMEFDSTEGSKRFHIYHPSNTYLEMDNDGNLVIKNEATRYNISKGACNDYVQDNKLSTVDGDNFEKVAGDDTKEVGGNVTLTATGNVLIQGVNVTLSAVNLSFLFTGTGTSVGSTGDMTWETTSGDIEINADTVHLNKP
jgi:hypothetical protein